MDDFLLLTHNGSSTHVTSSHYEHIHAKYIITNIWSLQQQTANNETFKS